VTGELVIGLAYSAAGFVVGLLVGLVGRRISMSEHIPRWRVALGLLILAMTTYAMITGVLTARHDRAVTECQSALNATFRAALIERASAQNIQNDAQATYLDIVANPATTPQQRMAALNVYRISLADARARRDAAPIPPNVACP
jgi:hypothetical protein